jgi:hypothetical protein
MWLQVGYWRSSSSGIEFFFEFCKVAEGKGLGVFGCKVAETKELRVKVAETEDLRMTSRMVRRTVAGSRMR